MAKRDRDRVGDVGRLREAGKSQLQLNGALHLRFRGATVSRRRFFDFCRGVRDDRNPGLRGGEHNRSAGVSHQNRGFRALVKGVKLFERHRVRLKRGDDLGDSVVNILDAFRERFGATPNDARFEKARSAGRNVQHGVTGGAQTGVDPHNNIFYFSRFAQFDKISSLGKLKERKKVGTRPKRARKTPGVENGRSSTTLRRQKRGFGATRKFPGVENDFAFDVKQENWAEFNADATRDAAPARFANLFFDKTSGRR